MTPPSSQNLDSFLQAYRDVGAYFVAPAVIAGGGQYPQSIGDFGILKRQLIVREAWEIGPNDLDGTGIQADDEPIIPDDVDNAPVKKLLEWRRTHTSEMNAKPSVQKSSGSRSSLSKDRKAKRKKVRRQRNQARKKRRRK